MAGEWNLWVCLVSVVVRRYIIDILIYNNYLLSPTPLVLLASAVLFYRVLFFWHIIPISLFIF